MPLDGLQNKLAIGADRCFDCGMSENWRMPILISTTKGCRVLDAQLMSQKAED